MLGVSGSGYYEHYEWTSKRSIRHAMLSELIATSTPTPTASVARRRRLLKPQRRLRGGGPGKTWSGQDDTGSTDDAESSKASLSLAPMPSGGHSPGFYEELAVSVRRGSPAAGVFALRRCDF